MKNFEGKSVDVPSCCLEPLSPNPVTIFSILNHTDNSPKTMTEIFSQSITPRNQSEQIFGAAKLEFQLPPLDIENNPPYAVFFRADPIVLSPNTPISPGFSPSTLLQSPNVLYDSSHIPPILVEGSNNDVPHQQPTYVDLPPQEGSNDIVVEESINVLYHEPHTEPIGAPLTGSFEFEADLNFMEVKEEADVKDIVGLIDIDTYEKKHGDQHIADDVDEFNAGETSAPKKRKCNKGSNNGAMRLGNQNENRVIIQMECEEDNPYDGYHWRKYGRKIVKGNPNPRSYYKCMYEGCKVKKHVVRDANNEKLLVTTYDGIHEHSAPTPRDYGKKNHNDLAQEYTTRTSRRLGRRNFTPSPHVDIKPPLASLGPQLDKTQSLPVYQNTRFLHQNDCLINQNPDFMRQNDNFMQQGDQSKNHNLGFMHGDDQVVSHNSKCTSQKCGPVDHSSSLMSINNQLVNQNSSSHNEQPVYHDPGFELWSDPLGNQNLCFMSLINQPVIQNSDFAFQNDHPVDSNSGFMHDYQVVNKSSSYIPLE